MADKTGIEWTDATWNPIRGCSRVSEGCRNCYAEKVAFRFSGAGQAYEGLVQIGADGERRSQWNGKIRFVEEHLFDPMRWRKPRRIFVNSMSDLFHENVTDEMLDKIFAVMAMCPRHTFQVLTKRPERALAYLKRFPTAKAWADHLSELNDAEGDPVFGEDSECFIHNVIVAPGMGTNHLGWPLRNVWLGVSVEDQAGADKRIPLLLQTPAAVRFISAEPLLGELNLHAHLCANGSTLHPEQRWSDSICEPRTGGLDWVIVGGESGPDARSMQIDWVFSLVEQCADAEVACFVKQMGRFPAGDPIGFFAQGTWHSEETGDGGPLLGDAKGGDWEEWPRGLRVREFPEVA